MVNSGNFHHTAPPKTGAGSPAPEAIVSSEPTATETDSKCSLALERDCRLNNQQTGDLTQNSSRTEDEETNCCDTSGSSSSSETSLFCSVPLDKVRTVLESINKSNILESYLLSKGRHDSQQQQQQDPAKIKNTKKLMCLYCERTFVTPNLKQKHVDRCHLNNVTRRSSSRLPNLNQTAGCGFCNKLNGTEYDLKTLFHHLVTEHASRYFGCLACEDRFGSAKLLQEHNVSVHGLVVPEETDSKSDVFVDVVTVSPSSSPVPPPPVNKISESPSCDVNNVVIAVDSEAKRPPPTIVSVVKKRRQRVPTAAAAPPTATTTGGKKIQSQVVVIESYESEADVDVETIPLEDFETAIPTNIVDAAELKSKLKDVDTAATDVAKQEPEDAVFKKPAQKKSNKRITVRSTKIGIRGNTKVESNVRTTRLQVKLSAEKAKKSKKPSKPKRIVEEKKATEERHVPSIESFFRVQKVTDHSSDSIKISSMTFDAVFDKAFYNRIKYNIQDNLSNHIDGKLFKNVESENRISNFEQAPHSPSEDVNKFPSGASENFGCDISLNAATPVPAPVVSQFGDDMESQIEYGAKASKKKTKTDIVTYKYYTRRKYQAELKEKEENRDLSKLDMWTQLVIKNRHQKFAGDQKSTDDMLQYSMWDGLKDKAQVEELNRILDRRGPFEDLLEEATAAREENEEKEKLTDCDIVKLVIEELLDKVDENLEKKIKQENSPINLTEDMGELDLELPMYFELQRCSRGKNDSLIDMSDRITLICSSQETENFESPSCYSRPKGSVIELTGEWTRPKIYICAACGLKLPNIKYLLEHKNVSHQNIWCQHYEFVGKQSELYRHLSIPGLGKVGAVEDYPMSKVWVRSDARTCTKCKKVCNSLAELHRHMLECGGDWTWMLARKKCKYRPYGSRSRRKRFRGLYARRFGNKENNDNKEPRPKKTYNKPKFEGPRPKPSDAESIQRMLANLPAKRATRKLITLQDGAHHPRKRCIPIRANMLPSKQVTKSEQSSKNTAISITDRKLTRSLMNKKLKHVIKSTRVKNLRAAVRKVQEKETVQSAADSAKKHIRRQSVRNINKVLSSAIIDSNKTLLTKRKFAKALTEARTTRLRAKELEPVTMPEPEKVEEQEEKSEPKNEKSLAKSKETTPKSKSKGKELFKRSKSIKKNILRKILADKKKKQNTLPEPPTEPVADDVSQKQVEQTEEVRLTRSNSKSLINLNVDDPKPAEDSTALVKKQTTPKSKTINRRTKNLIRALSIRKSKKKVVITNSEETKGEEKVIETKKALSKLASTPKQSSKRKITNSIKAAIKKVKPTKKISIEAKKNEENEQKNNDELPMPTLEKYTAIPEEPTPEIISTIPILTPATIDDVAIEQESAEKILPEITHNQSEESSEVVLASTEKPEEDIKKNSAEDKAVEKPEESKEDSIIKPVPVVPKPVAPPMKTKTKRPFRGLNDCIAMLTSKLQQKEQTEVICVLPDVRISTVEKPETTDDFLDVALDLSMDKSNTKSEKPEVVAEKDMKQNIPESPVIIEPSTTEIVAEVPPTICAEIDVSNLETTVKNIVAPEAVDDLQIGSELSKLEENNEVNIDNKKLQTEEEEVQEMFEKLVNENMPDSIAQVIDNLNKDVSDPSYDMSELNKAEEETPIMDSLKEDTKVVNAESVIEKQDSVAEVPMEECAVVETKIMENVSVQESLSTVVEAVEKAAVLETHFPCDLNAEENANSDLVSDNNNLEIEEINTSNVNQAPTKLKAKQTKAKKGRKIGTKRAKVIAAKIKSTCSDLVPVTEASAINEDKLDRVNVSEPEQIDANVEDGLPCANATADLELNTAFIEPQISKDITTPETAKTNVDVNIDDLSDIEDIPLSRLFKVNTLPAKSERRKTIRRSKIFRTKRTKPKITRTKKTKEVIENVESISSPVLDKVENENIINSEEILTTPEAEENDNKIVKETSSNESLLVEKPIKENVQKDDILEENAISKIVDGTENISIIENVEKGDEFLRPLEQDLSLCYAKRKSTRSSKSDIKQTKNISKNEDITLVTEDKTADLNIVLEENLEQQAIVSSLKGKSKRKTKQENKEHVLLTEDIIVPDAATEKSANPFNSENNMVTDNSKYIFNISETVKWMKSKRNQKKNYNIFETEGIGKKTADSLMSSSENIVDIAICNENEALSNAALLESPKLKRKQKKNNTISQEEISKANEAYSESFSVTNQSIGDSTTEDVNLDLSAPILLESSKLKSKQKKLNKIPLEEISEPEKINMQIIRSDNEVFSDPAPSETSKQKRKQKKNDRTLEDIINSFGETDVTSKLTSNANKEIVKIDDDNKILNPSLVTKSPKSKSKQKKDDNIGLIESVKPIEETAFTSDINNTIQNSISNNLILAESFKLTRKQKKQYKISLEEVAKLAEEKDSSLEIKSKNDVDIASTESNEVVANIPELLASSKSLKRRSKKQNEPQSEEINKSIKEKDTKDNAGISNNVLLESPRLTRKQKKNDKITPEELIKPIEESELTVNNNTNETVDSDNEGFGFPILLKWPKRKQKKADKKSLEEIFKPIDNSDILQMEGKNNTDILTSDNDKNVFNPPALVTSPISKRKHKKLDGNSTQEISKPIIENIGLISSSIKDTYISLSTEIDKEGVGIPEMLESPNLKRKHKKNNKIKKNIEEILKPIGEPESTEHNTDVMAENKTEVIEIPDLLESPTSKRKLTRNSKNLKDIKDILKPSEEPVPIENNPNISTEHDKNISEIPQSIESPISKRKQKRNIKNQKHFEETLKPMDEVVVNEKSIANVTESEKDSFRKSELLESPNSIRKLKRNSKKQNDTEEVLKPTEEAVANEINPEYATKIDQDVDKSELLKSANLTRKQRRNSRKQKDIEEIIKPIDETELTENNVFTAIEKDREHIGISEFSESPVSKRKQKRNNKVQKDVEELFRPVEEIAPTDFNTVLTAENDREHIEIPELIESPISKRKQKRNSKNQKEIEEILKPVSETEFAENNAAALTENDKEIISGLSESPNSKGKQRKNIKAQRNIEELLKSVEETERSIGNNTNITTEKDRDVEIQELLESPNSKRKQRKNKLQKNAEETTALIDAHEPSTNEAVVEIENDETFKRISELFESPYPKRKQNKISKAQKNLDDTFKFSEENTESFTNSDKRNIAENDKIFNIPESPKLNRKIQIFDKIPYVEIETNHMIMDAFAKLKASTVLDNASEKAIEVLTTSKTMESPKSKRKEKKYEKLLTEENEISVKENDLTESPYSKLRQRKTDKKIENVTDTAKEDEQTNIASQILESPKSKRKQKKNDPFLNENDLGENDNNKLISDTIEKLQELESEMFSSAAKTSDQTESSKRKKNKPLERIEEVRESNLTEDIRLIEKQIEDFIASSNLPETCEAPSKKVKSKKINSKKDHVHMSLSPTIESNEKTIEDEIAMNINETIIDAVSSALETEMDKSLEESTSIENENLINDESLIENVVPLSARKSRSKCKKKGSKKSKNKQATHKPKSEPSRTTDAISQENKEIENSVTLNELFDLSTEDDLLLQGNVSDLVNSLPSSTNDSKDAKIDEEETDDVFPESPTESNLWIDKLFNSICKSIDEDAIAAKQEAKSLKKKEKKSKSPAVAHSKGLIENNLSNMSFVSTLQQSKNSDTKICLKLKPVKDASGEISYNRIDNVPETNVEARFLQPNAPTETSIEPPIKVTKSKKRKSKKDSIETADSDVLSENSVDTVISSKSTSSGLSSENKFIRYDISESSVESFNPPKRSSSRKKKADINLEEKPQFDDLCIMNEPEKPNVTLDVTDVTSLSAAPVEIPTNESIRQDVAENIEIHSAAPEVAPESSLSLTDPIKLVVPLKFSRTHRKKKRKAGTRRLVKVTRDVITKKDSSVAIITPEVSTKEPLEKTETIADVEPLSFPEQPPAVENAQLSDKEGELKEILPVIEYNSETNHQDSGKENSRKIRKIKGKRTKKLKMQKPAKKHNSVISSMDLNILPNYTSCEQQIMSDFANKISRISENLEPELMEEKSLVTPKSDSEDEIPLSSLAKGNNKIAEPETEPAKETSDVYSFNVDEDVNLVETILPTLRQKIKQKLSTIAPTLFTVSENVLESEKPVNAIEDSPAVLTEKTPAKENCLENSVITTPDVADENLVIKIQSKLKMKVGKHSKKKSAKASAKKNVTEKVIVPTEEIFCDICNKTFARPGSLVLHKKTLTHIAKLSEIEAKEAEEKKINKIEDDLIESTRNDIVPKSQEEDKAENFFSSSLSLSSTNDNLKLADIINDVLDKPVVPHEAEFSAMGISNIVFNSSLSPQEDVSQNEKKRYRSLGERKSFDSDNVLMNHQKLDDFSTSNVNDSLLTKQISILENIILEETTKLKYMDDAISLTSNQSNTNENDVSVPKQFDNTQISFSSFIKPTEQNFVKPPQNSFEEISEDGRNQFEDMRSRKTLNRDEELFLECCSLLKSGSEISNNSKKSMRNVAYYDEFNKYKQSEKPDWLDSDSGDWYEVNSSELSNSNSKDSQEQRNNVNTFENCLADQIVNRDFDSSTSKNDNHVVEIDDDSDENTRLTSEIIVNNAEESEEEFEDSNITNLPLLQPPPPSLPQTENVTPETEKCPTPQPTDEENKKPLEEQSDLDFKMKVVSRFGGLMARALKNKMHDVVVKKTDKLIRNKQTSESTQTSITDYAVNVEKQKYDDTKKVVTKGALKVFEGLKVSIPTDELNMDEVMNCSPKNKKIELCALQHSAAPAPPPPIIEKVAKEPKEVKEPEIKEPAISKKKKSVFEKFGNKLGLKVTKKRSLPKGSQKKRPLKTKTKQVASANDFDSQAHDIYDFEETQDNTDVFTNNSFKSYRTKTCEEKKEPKLVNEEKYDSFTFGEVNSNSSLSTSVSSSTPSKRNAKASTKKKCMIMGRIFKNALKSKCDETPPLPDEIAPKADSQYEEMTPNDTVDMISDSYDNVITKREMNFLFDKLLNENPLKIYAEPEQSTPTEENTVPTTKLKSSSNKLKTKQKRRRHSSDSTDCEFSLNKTKKKTTNSKRSKKKDAPINLEQELKECIGVAGRKSQRKCTSGKQNVLVEYWSSDDSAFEALFLANFEESDTKASKSDTKNQGDVTDLDNINIEELLVQDEPGLEEVVEEKPEEITPIEPIVDLEKENEYTFDAADEEEVEEPEDRTDSAEMKARKREKRKKSTSKREKEKGKKKRKKSASESHGSDKVPTVQPITRRKRSAAETLYYWSSSSEDEFEDLIEVKPIREEDDDDRPMQHGWIVGDSPKKLVTMLAQAKGKKVESECVKENAKKRSTL